MMFFASFTRITPICLGGSFTAIFWKAYILYTYVWDAKHLFLSYENTATEVQNFVNECSLIIDSVLSGSIENSTHNCLMQYCFCQFAFFCSQFCIQGSTSLCYWRIRTRTRACILTPGKMCVISRQWKCEKILLTFHIALAPCHQSSIQHFHYHLLTQKFQTQTPRLKAIHLWGLFQDKPFK